MHLDQAIHLVGVILAGGDAELDRISEPLAEPELRARAVRIKSQLMRIRVLGMNRQLGSYRSGNGSSNENEFHAEFKDALENLRNLEVLLERIESGNEENSRFLFNGVLSIWALIVATATSGLWWRERARKKAEAALIKANEQLLSQAEELTEHREHLAELVERRTAELTTANELAQAEMAERLRTCDTLKETEQQILHLSTRLLSAQEVERRRISMELHDEFGQALNVMKLRTRVIEKRLSGDQRALREECEGLLRYMDNVIEDLRRLSLALSPTVLEDLGLTSALRWLISSFPGKPDINATSEIAEIDGLFSRNQWITIYRVVQEALTNIGKHAHAENVSVIVRHHDDSVVFSIEDDGNGFDPEKILTKDSVEKGLGLSTMSERIRILGGDFNLWSGVGNGTRITFSLSVVQGEV